MSVPDISFGDTEPEDAWDPGDSFPLLIDNLFRRLDLLDGDEPRASRHWLLGIIDLRLESYRRSLQHYDDRTRVRITQLDEDLTLWRGRA